VSEGDETPPAMLEYRTPERPLPGVIRWHVYAGLGSSVVAIGIAAPLVLIATYDPNRHSNHRGMAFALLLGFSLFIGISGWVASRSAGWRGVGQGMLIGLGIGVLLAGGCFVAIL